MSTYSDSFSALCHTDLYGFPPLGFVAIRRVAPPGPRGHPRRPAHWVPNICIFRLVCAPPFFGGFAHARTNVALHKLAENKCVYTHRNIIAQRATVILLAAYLCFSICYTFDGRTICILYFTHKSLCSWKENRTEPYESIGSRKTHAQRWLCRHFAVTEMIGSHSNVRDHVLYYNSIFVLWCW